ncbi:MAG: glycosyltransferase [Janthinobacterium lividum]
MHAVDLTMFYCRRGGGVTSYIDAKARWCARSGSHRHTVVGSSIASSAGKARATGCDVATVATHGVPIPGVATYRLPLRCHAGVQALRQLRPDIIEAGDACTCAWTAIRARELLGVPIVAFCHSDLAQLAQARFGACASRLCQQYLRHVYRQFDVVLAPSCLMVERLQAMGITAVHQPLGVDTGCFTAQRRDDTLRRQLGLSGQSRLLIYAGRFTAEKNLPLLVQAVEQLGEPYHLILLGSGKLPPLSRRVTVLPYLHEPSAIARLLASCDVMVHAGHSETFGLAVIEAMACGLPVVGPCAGGISELVDAQSGVLFQPGRVAALCEAVTAVSGQHRDAMGQAARQRVMQRYDWNAILPQMFRRYQTLPGMDRQAGSIPEAFGPDPGGKENSYAAD